MKNKKLYIISIFIFVIIITYGISLTQTEAPIQPKEPEELIQVKGVEINGIKTNTENEEKYKIISRAVVVPINILNKDKAVLLTIDDGPSIRTKEIMAVLKNHNANAIFFINGKNDKNNPGVIKEIEEGGFSLGNHTWSHMNLKKQVNDSIIETEINKTTNLIKNSTGEYPRFFRAPYGESNPKIRKIIKDDGMLFMDWSGAAMDWDKSTSDQDVFVGNVMKNVHSGSIILLHEHPWSLANLDALLNKLEEEGYTYVNPKNIIE